MELKDLIQLKETQNYVENDASYFELEDAFKKFFSNCFRLIRHSEYVNRFGNYFELTCRSNDIQSMSFRLDGSYIDEDDIAEETLFNTRNIPGLSFNVKNLN